MLSALEHRAVGTHHQGTAQSQVKLMVPRSAAQEKGLWLRGAIDLDGQEYAGRASSRKDVFGGDSDTGCAAAG